MFTRFRVHHRQVLFVILMLLISFSVLPSAGQDGNISLPDNRDDAPDTAVYLDGVFGFQFAYPYDWSIEVSLENSEETPDKVILRTITLTDPSGEQVYVDIWENSTDKDLLTLYKKNHRSFLSSAAPEVTGSNGTVAGVSAVLVTDPSTKKEIKKASINPSQVAIFTADGYSYRVEYQKTLNGEAEGGVTTILQSFALSAAKVPLAELSALTPLPVTEAVIKVATCGVLSDPGNPYPCCKNKDGNGGNCTWYARYRRPEFGNRNFGNAKDWLKRAKQAGFATGKTPQVGAIAVWTSGTYGHVAYVESIVNSSTIKVSQMNCKTPPAYTPPPGKSTSTSGIAGYIYKTETTQPPDPTGWIPFGSGGASTLSINNPEVYLKVCGASTASYDLYVSMQRGPVQTYPGVDWRYIIAPDGTVKQAQRKDWDDSTWSNLEEFWAERSGICTTLRNMEGPYDSFAGVEYKTRAALNAAPDPNWSIPCASATNGLGLCDKISR